MAVLSPPLCTVWPSSLQRWWVEMSDETLLTLSWDLNPEPVSLQSNTLTASYTESHCRLLWLVRACVRACLRQTHTCCERMSVHCDVFGCHIALTQMCPVQWFLVFLAGMSVFGEAAWLSDRYSRCVCRVVLRQVWLRLLYHNRFVCCWHLLVTCVYIR